jgi:hypothetical protein
VLFQLSSPQVKAAPLICFEDTLGDLTRRTVLSGAQILVNLTNDGWFQKTAGAEQHLSNAIFRAVETRRPLVRSTNTGLTGAVDTMGRWKSWIEPFTENVAIGKIDVPTSGALTFYTRHGDWFAYLSAAAGLLWLAVRRGRAGEMSSSSLEAAGPLRDPVRCFARILLWLSLISLAITFVTLLHGFGGAAPSKPKEIGALALILLIVGVPLPLGIWLLVRRATRRPVIYLRAFRSDREAVRLRQLLKAALGPRLRLCGIRPPGERSNWLSRLAGHGLVALRYFGSPQLDLEAEDHNWMARLLATYAHSRFAFIDVRDLTAHVENEIRLTYSALGRERCVFIVNDERPLPEWRATIGQVLGVPGKLQGGLQLLSYPGDECVAGEEFVLHVMKTIGEIPEGTAPISHEAVAFARERVATKDWATPFWETERGLSFIALALGLLLVFAINLLPPDARQRAGMWLALALGGLTLLFYFPAWARSWRQAGVDARYRRTGEPRPRPPLVFSLLLVLFYLFIACSLPVMRERGKRSAQRTLADSDLMKAEMAIHNYNREYGRFPEAARWESAMLGTDHEVNPRAIIFLPDRKSLTDPWGTPFRYRLDEKNEHFELRSAGPDRQFDTPDDLHRP